MDEVLAMSIPLAELTSHEPAELPADRPVRLVFSGAIVKDPATGAEVQLAGPVDFARWGSCVFQLTDPKTGTSKIVPGLCLLVSEVDGTKISRRLNVVARRLVELLRPYLEDGSYLKLRFTITKIGERPRSTFNVVPAPL